MDSQTDNSNVYSATPAIPSFFQEDDDFWQEIATGIHTRRRMEPNNDVHGDMHGSVAQLAIHAPCEMPGALGTSTVQRATSPIRYLPFTQCAHQETPSTVHGATPQTCCAIPMRSGHSMQHNARCIPNSHDSNPHGSARNMHGAQIHCMEHRNIATCTVHFRFAQCQLQRTVQCT
jgi:hypothetical protein